MCVVLWFFEFSVGIGGFVIGLGQISFFFSLIVSGTELQTDRQTNGQTDGRTDDPITRCPRRTFQAGGIKICISLQNYWHRVTDITSFGKQLESFLGHTLNFCPNLVQYPFQNVSKRITYPVFHDDLVYKLRRIKGETNFISSGSKIVKCLRRRQYDPVIIGRTIGLVLGPLTALYRSFLKRCTLTNKAIGTIWRALSKPPQRRQGPDPWPLRLIVGTPSAFWPALAYRLRVAQPTLMDDPIYFWYTIIYYYICFCTTFLWPPRFGWLLVLSL